MSPTQWNYPNSINQAVNQRGAQLARQALAEAALRKALAEIRALEALQQSAPATQSQEVSNG